MDAFGCDIVVSSAKDAIGAAIANKSIADAKRVIGFIGEFPSGFPSMCRACTGVRQGA
jgi:hypothetical protein